MLELFWFQRRKYFISMLREIIDEKNKSINTFRR